MHLRALGESVIEVGDVRITPSAPHMFAALLYLVLEAGRRIPRSRLQELLFPTADARSASHSLRQLLYRLRRVGVQLECDAASVMLAQTSKITGLFGDIDLSRPGVAAIRTGILPGFDASFSDPFSEWLELRRSELLARVRRDLTAELVARRSKGEWHLVEHAARCILSIDPLNEEATLALAEVTALNGSKLSAIRMVDDYLDEVGKHAAARLPASILRRRIAEKLPAPSTTLWSPLIGREEQLAVLRDHFNRLGSSGGACLVSGPPGIGKTRLVTEFSKHAVLDGASVVQVSSQPHDVMRPMGAFSDVVPVLLKLRGSLGCSPAALAVLRKLSTYTHGVDDLRSSYRDAEMLAASITSAVSDLLDAIGAENATILVFEDAQWLDPISVQVVGDLMAAKIQRRTMFIVSSREPSSAYGAVARMGLISEIRVPPLRRDESTRLLTTLLAEARLTCSDERMSVLLDVAGGNPYFLHSLIAHYAANGGEITQSGPLTDLLTQRLSSLSRTTRRTVEACAVLGRNATVTRLEEMLGLSTISLLAELEALEHRGLIDCRDGRVSMTHALLSDLTKAQSPLGVRALLHARAARILQRELVRTESSGLLWDCAEHWRQAGVRTEAIAALRECARHALQIGRPRHAVDALREAARGGLHSPQDRSVIRELVTAAQIAGDWSTVLEAAQRGASLCSGDQQSRFEHAEFEMAETEALLHLGRDYEVVGQRLRRLLIVDALREQDRLHVCVLSIFVAEYLLSPELADLAFATAKALRVAGESNIEAHLLDVVYHASFGDMDLAPPAAMRAVAMAESLSNPGAACRALLTAAGGLLRAGCQESALSTLIRAHDLAERRGLRSLQFRAASHLACAYRDAGSRGRATEWHTRSENLAAGYDCRDGMPTFLSNSVLAAIEAGDFPRARSVIRKAFHETEFAVVGEAKLHFTALDLRCRQLADADYDCPEDELTLLLDDHHKYRSLGFHDEVVEALWHALTRKGRLQSASRLLREYLQTYRRYRGPLPPGLRELALDLNVAPREAADLSTGNLA